MSRLGSAKATLEALPDLVRHGGGKQMALANEAAIGREFQITRAFGARHVFAGDADYPLLLSHLDNAPAGAEQFGRQSGSSQATVQMVLLEFELAGQLDRGAGGKVRFKA